MQKINYFSTVLSALGVVAVLFIISPQIIFAMTEPECRAGGGMMAAGASACVSPDVPIGSITDSSGNTIGTCCAAPGTPPPTATPSVGGMQYTLLEKIPGGSNARAGDLAGYLQDLYRFTFWAIGIAALFMLSVGGFMYVTSAGNTSRMGTAKEIIFDSIIGIVIALLAWLFLYIINPDFLSMKLPTVSPVTTTPGATGTPTPGLPAPSGSAQALATSILAAGSGVTLASSGDCKMTGNIPVTPSMNMNEVKNGGAMTACSSGCDKNGTLCTGKTNVSSSMLQAVLDVAKQYPFQVTSFAGGSHGNGTSHYIGKGIDIAPPGSKATEWPKVLAAFKARSSYAICEKPGGAKTPDNDCTGADHIHVSF